MTVAQALATPTDDMASADEEGNPVTKVTMEIPPALASQMAQFFLDEGFAVSWDGPLEKRAGGIERELIQIVFWLKDNAASGLVGGAAYTAAQSTVRRIRERFPSVKAEVQEDAEN